MYFALVLPLLILFGIPLGIGLHFGIIAGLFALLLISGCMLLIIKFFNDHPVD